MQNRFAKRPRNYENFDANVFKLVFSTEFRNKQNSRDEFFSSSVVQMVIITSVQGERKEKRQRISDVP